MVNDANHIVSNIFMIHLEPNFPFVAILLFDIIYKACVLSETIMLRIWSFRRIPWLDLCRFSHSFGCFTLSHDGSIEKSVTQLALTPGICVLCKNICQKVMWTPFAWQMTVERGHWRESDHVFSGRGVQTYSNQHGLHYYTTSCCSFSQPTGV